MRKAVLVVLCILLTLLLIPPATSYEQLEKYVNDFAGLLTPDQELKLNQLATSIENTTSVEIAIVTLKTTNGEDRIQYANKLGEQSGVGKASTDNGVVILWTQENEKGGAIATGRGIESVLTDSFVTRVGRASRSYFDNKQFFEGFNYIIQEISTELKPGEAEQTTQTTKNNNPGAVFVVSVFVIAIVIILSLPYLLSRHPRYEESTVSYSDSEESAYDQKNDLPRRFPEAFLKNYKIIKKEKKYYKRTEEGIYALVSAAMLLYLWNRWNEKEENDDASHGHIGRSSSYTSSSSSGSEWSSYDGGDSFGGGSFGGGGGSF